MSVAAATRGPIRRVGRAMGTAVVIDTIGDALAGSAPAGAAVDAAFAELRRIEAVFSTFQPDSQISRIGRGELAPDEATPEVLQVLARCASMTALTDGAFTIRPDRPGTPPLDPSGLVKGWAVDRGAVILRQAGLERFAINAGGDVLVAGGSSGRPWRVGVRHPDDPASVAAVLELEDGAVATSGTYERDAHLWGRAAAQDGGPPPQARAPLRSVTVVGPELGLADALATATFVGDGATPWWSRCPGYEVLAVRGDRVGWTSGLDRIVVAPAGGRLEPTGTSGTTHRNL